MCQRAVDPDRNLEQARDALGDLEAQPSGLEQVSIAEARRDVARRTQESLESAHEIHMSLVWIEVFIVVAYAAEIVKFFAIELPHVHDPVLRPWDRRRHVRRRGGVQGVQGESPAPGKSQPEGERA